MRIIHGCALYTRKYGIYNICCFLSVVTEFFLKIALINTEFFLISLYLYVPDEGNLLPKYRDCTTSNDFELHIYDVCIYTYIFYIIYIYIHLIYMHFIYIYIHLIYIYNVNRLNIENCIIFKLGTLSPLDITQNLTHFPLRIFYSRNCFSVV